MNPDIKGAWLRRSAEEYKCGMPKTVTRRNPGKPTHVRISNTGGEIKRTGFKNKRLEARRSKRQKPNHGNQ